MFNIERKTFQIPNFLGAFSLLSLSFLKDINLCRYFLREKQKKNENKQHKIFINIINLNVPSILTTFCSDLSIFIFFVLWIFMISRYLLEIILQTDEFVCIA